MSTLSERMYVRRVELQGFKTFAQKMVLEFAPLANGKMGVTAIVGPNGSGKSNIADAIRWVMGEQSLKLLRSKKSEDVIFSGSKNRARSGFAEVTLTLVNDGATSDIDMPEIVVTRRLYRDGQSEYEVNRQLARLTDVVLLLAQCGIGQRTYSVIGQGMVDAVLSASPAERKEFFDEAAGLRVFQLKRQQAMNKLHATRENLQQANLLLHEIEPRLASLERQIKRLRERESIEAKLREHERAYFGSVWIELQKHLSVVATHHSEAEAFFISKNHAASAIEQELLAMEKAVPLSQEMHETRETLDALKEERAKWRETQIRFETKKEMARAHAETAWSPLPLSTIIEEISELINLHAALTTLVEAKKPDMAQIRSMVTALASRHETLLNRLQPSAPTGESPKSGDESRAEKEPQELVEAIDAVTKKIHETERRLEELGREEESGRTHLFEMQRELSAKRHEAQAAERKLSDASVELARFETRRDSFVAELRAQAPWMEQELDRITADLSVSPSPESSDMLRARMQRLRSQLELIGGIDPATTTEYTETHERVSTLRAQTEDLRQALGSLEIVIAELDTTIKERGESAFKRLDKEFGLYFKKLFGGGEARLIQLDTEPTRDHEEEEPALAEDTPESGIIGIELQATPPGKRLKSIALLSGGERALTSIALICAIMATNPSPFVVLDEVDAALDESNSKKFADILNALAHQTQFIVITHNRATMHVAHALYGVTMRDEGTSQILSVTLET